MLAILCSLNFLNLFASKTQAQGHCSCKVPGTAGTEAPCYGDKMQAFGWTGDWSGCQGDFPGSSDDPRLAQCLPREQGQAVYILGDSFAWAIQSAFQHATSLPVHQASWTMVDEFQGKVNPDVGPGHLAKVIKPNDIVVHISAPQMGHTKHLDAIKNMTGAHGAKLLILNGWPTLPKEPAMCYMFASKTGKPGEKSQCWQPYEQAALAGHSRTQQASQLLDKNTFMLDLSSIMCNKDTGCDMWIPGTSLPAYMDISHVNEPMDQYLAKYVCEFLDEKFSAGHLH